MVVVVAHAGIVEEQVDAVEGFHDSREKAIHLCGNGDIAGDSQRLGLSNAGVGDRGVQHILAPAAENRVPAILEKRRRYRFANAGARSGDDRGLAVLHGIPPFREQGIADEAMWQARQKGRSLATALIRTSGLGGGKPIRLIKMMRLIG